MPILSSAIIAVTLTLAGDPPELSSKAQSVAWTITHHGYMDKCRPDEPIPDKPMSLQGYVGQCKHGVEESEKRIAEFTAEERKHPEVREALAVFKKDKKHASKVIKHYEKLQKDDEQQDELYARFKADVEKHSDALWVLRKIDEGDTPHNVIWDEMLAQIDELASFAKTCSSYVAITKKLYSPEFFEVPKNACGIAQNRSKILAGKLPELFATMRAKDQETSDEFLDRIEGDDGVYVTTIACARSPKECSSNEPSIAMMAKRVGISPGQPPADNPRFDAVLKKAAKARKIGAYKNSKLQKLAGKALKAAGVKTLATAVFTSSDVIVKDSYNMPLRREREIGFLVKMDGENFCRAYSMVALGQYRGGGRYEPMEILEVPDLEKTAFVISACK